MSTLPTSTREVRLVAAPDGLPAPGDFAVFETPLAAPGPDQVLVRNRAFLVFPGLRSLIGGELESAALPTVRPGTRSSGPRSARSWPRPPKGCCAPETW